MSSETVTVEITREAADCLAWFTATGYCGETPSEVIVWNAQAYCNREHWDYADAGIEGLYSLAFENGENVKPND